MKASNTKLAVPNRVMQAPVAVEAAPRSAGTSSRAAQEGSVGPEQRGCTVWSWRSTSAIGSQSGTRPAPPVALGARPTEETLQEAPSPPPPASLTPMPTTDATLLPTPRTPATCRHRVQCRYF